jgi:hypothetical protein
MFLLASSASAVEAVRPDSVVVPVMLAFVIVTDVMVTLPLEMVTFDSVSPLSVVVVFPKKTAVLPSVIAVAKLLSSWDRGILLVAEPKVYGTAILEPHS